MTKIHLIHEHRYGDGRYRLGRHVEHDPRSRNFPASSTEKMKLRSRRWTRHCAPFDQGSLGSCTGNAAAGVAMTDPVWRPGRALTEVDAVNIYTAATRLDQIPGHYPPDDTGSSGLAASKVLRRLNIISRYSHAFGVDQLLTTLVLHGSVMVGVNWYEGFDRPIGRNAEIRISGAVRGGHEFQINEYDHERRLLRGPNSWGLEYGDHGYMTLSVDTMARLLDEQGDCVRVHPLEVSS